MVLWGKQPRLLTVDGFLMAFSWMTWIGVWMVDDDTSMDAVRKDFGRKNSKIASKIEEIVGRSAERGYDIFDYSLTIV